MKKGGVGQMNKLFIIFALLCVLIIIGPSFQVHALSFEQLPKNQESEQWSVQVGAAELDKTTVRPQKDVYGLYSFKVKNIGKNVGSITVQTFRDEPNSKTKFVEQVVHNILVLRHCCSSSKSSIPNSYSHSYCIIFSICLTLYVNFCG